MDITILWEDCSICFICPNCGIELLADTQLGADECECGVKYSLATSLNVTMPGKTDI